MIGCYLMILGAREQILPVTVVISFMGINRDIGRFALGCTVVRCSVILNYLPALKQVRTLRLNKYALALCL